MNTICPFWISSYSSSIGSLTFTIISDSAKISCRDVWKIYGPNPDAFFQTHGGNPAPETFADDFNGFQGWAVTNDPSLTGGAWQRAIPSGNGDRGDPTDDSDASPGAATDPPEDAPACRDRCRMGMC